MIAYLQGKVYHKEPQTVVIRTAGVGYEVLVPLSTYYEIGDEGSDVELMIHTHVREDSFTLFGFISAGERSMFRRLINISGLGPKLALAIIGSIGPAEFLDAIEAAQLQRIVKVPGVGKKTAERLIVELKDKVMVMREEIGVSRQLDTIPGSTLQFDVISALENLGYRTNLAEKATKEAMDKLEPPASFEELLRKSLSLLTS